MPEGDTLFVTARVLAKALQGRTVTAVRRDARLPASLDPTGLRIEEVSALGKNLLVRFSDGRVLRTHLRMTGSWHLYRPGEAWKLPARRARLVLETDAWIAVCFSAPEIELLPPGGAARHPTLATLGPDLLRDGFDAIRARENLKSFAAEPLAVSLLRQRAVAGIGNLWRCETLFLLALDPLRSTGERSDAELDLVLATARRLMREAARPYAGAPGLARPRPQVHDRAGAPCPRCGELVRVRALGDPPRNLFYCPACQTR
jgi:endonuclease-8